MKKWILPACLIAVGIIASVLGYIHSSNTISKQSAEQITTDYIINNSDYYDKTKYKAAIANLDTNLFGIVFGTQHWTVYTIFPQGWLEINAYNGRIEDVHYGFYEWVTQSENTVLPIDFLPVVPYIFMITFSILYSKSVSIKVLFWVFVALFILSFIFPLSVRAFIFGIAFFILYLLKILSG